jgi:hypothetical protein
VSRAITDPWLYGGAPASAITVYPLKENKRPVGFAPWPEAKKVKRRKKGKKS